MHSQKLNVQLQSGTLELSDIGLNAKNLTAALQAAGLQNTLTVLSAAVKRLRIHGRYSTLPNEGLTLQIEGLQIDVGPPGQISTAKIDAQATPSGVPSNSSAGKTFTWRPNSSASECSDSIYNDQP